jgi:hypothetical protein
MGYTGPFSDRGSPEKQTAENKLAIKSDIEL